MSAEILWQHSVISRAQHRAVTFRRWGGKPGRIKTKSQDGNGRGRSKTGCSLASWLHSKAEAVRRVPYFHPSTPFFFKRGEEKESSVRTQRAPENQEVAAEELKTIFSGDSKERDVTWPSGCQSFCSCPGRGSPRLFQPHPSPPPPPPHHLVWVSCNLVSLGSTVGYL